MRKRNGLRSSDRLTQSSYRKAVSETVRSLQGELTDEDMAQAWGVGSGTVLNARNRNHDLTAIPLLQLGERFGTEALATVLRLIGMKAIDERDISVDVSTVPCDVAKCVPLLITLLGDGHCSNEDVHQLDEAGVINTLSEISEMLNQRRDRMRLRAV